MAKKRRPGDRRRAELPRRGRGQRRRPGIRRPGHEQDPAGHRL